MNACRQAVSFGAVQLLSTQCSRHRQPPRSLYILRPLDPDLHRRVRYTDWHWKLTQSRGFARLPALTKLSGPTKRGCGRSKFDDSQGALEGRGNSDPRRGINLPIVPLRVQPLPRSQSRSRVLLRTPCYSPSWLRTVRRWPEPLRRMFL